MNRNERAATAISEIASEIRRQVPPELDWVRVETALFAHTGRAPASRPKPSRWPFGLAFAATLGVAVFGVALAWRHPAPVRAANRPSSPAAVESVNTLDGDSLAIGATILASTGPLRIEHRGHATWTLDGDSEAHLESLGDVVTVVLDRGALSARVVKSPRPESFVVRVEKTRIAVHGTAFRVERLGSTVRIAVTEGVVGVGPIGQAPFELPAPSKATVTLDGIRVDQAGASRRPAVQDGPHPATEDGRGVPPPAAGTTEEEATATTAAGTPAGVARMSVDRVESVVRECFAKHTMSRGDLRITLRTSMSLRASSTGKIIEAAFDPPLADGVRTCVDVGVRQIHLASPSGGLSVERVLELER